MLKMLRHDLKYVWKSWRFVAPAILLVCMVCGLLIRFIDFEVMMEDEIYATAMLFYTMTAMLTNYGGLFLLAGFSMLVSVLIMVRYYKNFFTDEAYLTFTLPVSRASLFNAKVIMSFVWTAATTAVTILGLVLWVLCAFDIRDVIEFFKMYGDLFSMSGIQINGGDVANVVFLILETVVMSVVAAASNLLLMYISITAGAMLVNKLKLLLGIGIYLGANAAVSGIAQIVSIIFSMFSTIMAEEGNMGWYYAINHFQIIIMIVAYTVLGVACYVVNMKLIQKKLNLA